MAGRFNTSSIISAFLRSTTKSAAASSLDLVSLDTLNSTINARCLQLSGGSMQEAAEIKDANGNAALIPGSRQLKNADGDVLLDWSGSTLSGVGLGGAGVRPPYNFGDVAGSITLDYANGPSQFGSINGDITLYAPNSGSDGAEMDIMLYASEAYTLNFLGIAMGDLAASLLPVTLESGRSYRISLMYLNGGWQLMEVSGLYSGGVVIGGGGSGGSLPDWFDATGGGNPGQYGYTKAFCVDGDGTHDHSVSVGYFSDGTYYGAAVGCQASGAYYGAAVGYYANGTYYGAAVGSYAYGSNFGAAFGSYAYGSNFGAAFGSSANGDSYGAALGYQASGYSNGAALGYQASGAYYGAAVGNSAGGDSAGAAFGSSAYGADGGAAVGYNANGYSYGAAVGYNAVGNASGAAVGSFAYGSNHGVAIGCEASTTGLAQRIEIGPKGSDGVLRPRISGQYNKSIQFTAPQTDTAPANAVFAFGNANDTLPQSMWTAYINAAGTSLKLYVNIGGTIKSATLALT